LSFLHCGICEIALAWTPTTLSSGFGSTKLPANVQVGIIVITGDGGSKNLPLHTLSLFVKNLMLDASRFAKWGKVALDE
jgi:hypothetical protein